MSKSYNEDLPVYPADVARGICSGVFIASSHVTITKINNMEAEITCLESRCRLI